MRLCLMVEGQEDVTWDQWLALAEATERTGLDGLFRSDHYLSGDGRVGRGSLDAWTTLAGIAAHTSRIRLGTMVSPATFRHPSVLGNSATTVDHISGGRVELGLGAGWYEMEHEAFGFPFPPLGTRMQMLAEQLEIITRQWTEDEFSFAGDALPLDRCPSLPRPVQQPPPTGDHRRRRQAPNGGHWRCGSPRSTTSSPATSRSAGRCANGSTGPARRRPRPGHAAAVGDDDRRWSAPTSANSSRRLDDLAALGPA